MIGAPSSTGLDVNRYVAELQALRQILVAAQAEQEACETKIAEVRL